MLSSGKPVEVLESDGDWSQVRVLEGKMSGKEGWVVSRYLLTRLPWKKQSESLRKENELLKDKLPVVEKKLNDALRREKTLTIKLRDNTKTLNTLEGEYTSLKQGSTGYLKLKKKYDETQILTGNQMVFSRLPGSSLRFDNRSGSRPKAKETAININVLVVTRKKKL